MDVDVYRSLAEFRHQIRLFLQVSEQATRTLGIEPQQHQLMMTLKGLPTGTRPTVTSLAQRLCLKHHSAVELVNRLAGRGLVMRRPSQEDRREVLVELTPLAEEFLEKLSDLHYSELRTHGPTMCKALMAILEQFAQEEAKPEAPPQALIHAGA